ncbi:Cation/H+ exchanger [Trinorchestia longiramus]|nr:Cation/H+ exchanger [Trinorchestia longiramus]
MRFSRLTESLVFASLISAVDPVAVLSIFQELGVNKGLYFLVFGESLLNDGVTVVVYNMFSTYMEMPTIQAADYALSVLVFFVVVAGGTLIGLIFGIVTALSTKYTDTVRDSLPSASKVNVSTKNSHHLMNSTRSQQQSKGSRNQSSCLRTGSAQTTHILPRTTRSNYTRPVKIDDGLETASEDFAGLDNVVRVHGHPLSVNRCFKGSDVWVANATGIGFNVSHRVDCPSLLISENDHPTRWSRLEIIHEPLVTFKTLGVDSWCKQRPLNNDEELASQFCDCLSNCGRSNPEPPFALAHGRQGTALNSITPRPDLRPHSL